jgi:suppressor of ftsI
MTRGLGSVSTVLVRFGVAVLITLLTAQVVIAAEPANVGATMRPTAYSEPPVLRSRNGVLRVTFAPQMGSVIVNGRTVYGMTTFTGTYPGPTLKVKPGDTIEMKFVNLLDEDTNLHFHGFRVSPSGLADNVLRTIAPAVTSVTTSSGQSVKIVVHIPKVHPPGLYWYHPHMHGMVDGQVYPGLAGLIVIDGILRDLPQLKGIKQRVMALQSIQLDGNQLVDVNDAEVSKEVTLLNGHYQPTLTIRPGELQLWRIGNISNDFWYRLSLGGPKFHVIAEDGNPVAKVWTKRHLVLPPGKRFEFLVRGPAAGRYLLESLRFNQGNDKFGRYTVANVISTGTPVANRLAIPSVASRSQARIMRATLADSVDRKRTLTFSIEDPFPADDQAFKINGQLFDEDVVNERVTLGTTEQWLLRNTSPEDHPFHIHTNDFLVKEINGNKVPINGFRDVVSIPRMRDGKPGTVLIRMRFRTFTGKAVFHCHILFHEDNAMMGIIQFRK